MLKKPLFWIIVVVAATVLWFIFAGHNKRNPSEMLSSRLPANHSEITGIPSNTEQTASNPESNDNKPSTDQVVVTHSNPSASEPNDSGALSDKQSAPSASADNQDDSSASADSQDNSSASADNQDDSSASADDQDDSSASADDQDESNTSADSQGDSNPTNPSSKSS